MPETLVTVAYLAAGLLFIFSLDGLSKQESARRGNLLGMAGMVIAVLVTAFGPRVDSYMVMTVALVVGGAIGAVLAARVEMTSMPQLVAILHSFVGAAAVLVGIATALDHDQLFTGIERRIHDTEIFVGIFVGAITFTGSVIAFGKLQGLIGSKPLLLPGRHVLNLVMLLACVYLGYTFVTYGDYFPVLWPLLVVTAIASLLGIHLVMAIGGADMPVVVSMLNSYSGWAAAAAGFMLENDLLIITGALVGSSGAILSYIMCAAMNRSFLSVILGGFGAEEGAAPGGAAAQPAGEVKSVTAEEAAELLRDAKSVIVVPGYGMAVAQAQYSALRSHQAAPRQGRERPLRDPPGRRPPAGPHERAAGGSQGAVRHRAGDGRDQRRVSDTPTSCSSSAPTTSSIRAPSTIRRARSTGCRSSKCGRRRPPS